MCVGGGGGGGNIVVMVHVHECVLLVPQAERKHVSLLPLMRIAIEGN